MKRDEIALMYSGGLDTTYAAIRLAESFSKVHLLTFCNGVCVRLKASERHVSILRERFGVDRIAHSIIDARDIFGRLREDLSEGMRRHNSPLVFDLCCRLAMETATIIYCLKSDVGCASDGSNPRTQGQMFIQQAEYLKEVDLFYSRHGIESIRPYELLKNRDEIIAVLKDYGIDTGIGWLKYLGITNQLLTQPVCLWAPVPFLFTSDLRKIPFIKRFGLSVEDAIEIRKEKEETAHKIIGESVDLKKEVALK